MGGFGNYITWVAGLGIASFGAGLHSPEVMTPGCILIGAALISEAVRGLYDKQR